MKRLAALLLALAPGALAQCVMCFRTAAAQQAARARVLNIGIIIMLIPPLLILGGFVLLLYVRRTTYATAEPLDFQPEAELEPAVSGGRR